MKVSDISHALYDFVDSVYDMQLELEPDSHTLNCLKLFTIASLYDVLGALGCHEHTNDWDLCVVLTLTDGTRLVVWAFDLSALDGLTLCLDAGKVTTIRCQVFDDDNSDNERWLDVAIDSIQSVSLSDTAGA